VTTDSKIATLTRKIEKLINLVNDLHSEIKDLRKENDKLKEKLAKYEHPKNNNNSSIPPSKDENRAFKSKSLRKKSGRKPGGQKGHEGTTLVMTADPDQTIEHTPDYCECCGKDIGTVPGEFVARRQEVDIPPIKPVITEHRIYKKQCSCGHVTTSDFPNGITAPISYGPMIESLTGYFHSRQYIPFKRMEEIFRDIFSLPISEGGIHCLLNRLCDKAHPWYQKIWEQVMHSSVVGSDETGVQTHQLCTAHLLRELKYLEERYQHRWPVRFTKFILDGLELKKRMDPGDYYQPLQKRTELEERLDRLLASRIDQNHKELASFQKRMLKYKDYILTFLYHPKVPPDNNGSEQAIRNVKVKQKVSGQFKSWKGVENFLILRSITDTALKNKQPVLNALNLIAKFEGTD
jgi:transposase